ncbi:hypothetical protein NQ315_013843, partial [Exocentrus adspersus]
LYLGTITSVGIPRMGSAFTSKFRKLRNVSGMPGSHICNSSRKMWFCVTCVTIGTASCINTEVKMCNFDIVALQETKQAGELVMEVGEYIFINSGGTDRMLDADADHFMVGAQIVQLLPEARNQATEKTRNNRIARLRTNEEKRTLEAISNNTGENKTIEESWGEIKAKLEVTAKKCMKEKKKEKKEWFDEERKRELQSRRKPRSKLRLKMLQEGTERKNKFEEQRRNTKMML